MRLKDNEDKRTDVAACRFVPWWEGEPVEFLLDVVRSFPEKRERMKKRGCPACWHGRKVETYEERPCPVGYLHLMAHDPERDPKVWTSLYARIPDEVYEWAAAAMLLEGDSLGLELIRRRESIALYIYRNRILGGRTIAEWPAPKVSDTQSRHASCEDLGVTVRDYNRPA